MAVNGRDRDVPSASLTPEPPVADAHGPAVIHPNSIDVDLPPGDVVFRPSNELTQPEIETEHKFGAFSWYPKNLQWLVTFPAFMVLIFFNAFAQGAIVNGFISTSISSIEKKFKLTSTQTGVFAAMYDVAYAIFLTPYALLHTSGYKVRKIGCGMILVGIGSLITVIPSFTSSAYHPDDLKSDVCDVRGDPSGNSGACATLPWYISIEYLTMMFGQIIVGIGAIPLFTSGFSCIDEFDSHERTGTNMAHFMIASTLGPAFAFIASSQMLGIWGDIGRTTPQSFGIDSTADPRWYGAWWSGFVVFGVLSILGGIPFTLFPHKLRDTDKRKKNDTMQTHSKLNMDFSKGKSEVRKVFCMFIRSKTIMAVVFMQAIEGFIMNGYITFVPKIFETRFSYSSGFSSLMTGIIVIPTGAFGTYVGGLLSKYMKNQFKPSMYTVISFMASSILFTSCLLIHCADSAVPGLNVPYPSVIAHGVNQTCNLGCDCRNLFNPVCSKGLSYLSPCHAGCPRFELGSTIWTNCTCGGAVEVTKGWCEKDCVVAKLLFFALFGALSFSIFACAPIMQSAMMRIVKHDHRDYLLIFNMMFMRIFGSLPGAIAFGVVIDYTCLYWKTDCEGTQCLYYDVKSLGFGFAIFTFLGKCMSIALLFVSARTYVKVEDSSSNDSADKEKSADEENFDPGLSIRQRLPKGISPTTTMVY